MISLALYYVTSLEEEESSVVNRTTTPAVAASCWCVCVCVHDVSTQEAVVHDSSVIGMGSIHHLLPLETPTISLPSCK